MRKLLVLTAVLFLTLASSGTRASESLHLEHYAPLPCTAVCSFWDHTQALGYGLCERDFPEGSYDQTVLRITNPTGTVKIWAYPPVDYDTVACSDTEPSRLVATPDPFERCNCGIAGCWPLPVPCRESLEIRWADVARIDPDTTGRFRLVSYNFSDAGSLTIRGSGPVDVVDDSYEAKII